MVIPQVLNLVLKTFLSSKIPSAIFVLLLYAATAHAQQFTIKRIELAEQKVIVHYDLADTVKGRTYSITVYRSNDNFLNPLQHASGDVGQEILPGNNKKFSWDAKAELGENFNGSVSLEVRGKLYIPFVRFGGFDEYKAIKRLKPYEITWSGGTPQNILNFDLYRGNKKVMTFPNIANVGHYKLTLPKDVKPGKDYWFQISDTKNKDEVVKTGTFIVKRKTPLILKILPVVAIGLGATLLVGDDDKGPSNIPDPIVPQ